MTKPQGVKMKVFYTAYQGNIYGIEVPADSPIKSFSDLKGKKIGVASMASGGTARNIPMMAQKTISDTTRGLVSAMNCESRVVVRCQVIEVIFG